MYNTIFQASSSLGQYLNESQVRGDFHWEGAAIFLGGLALIGVPVYLYGLIRDRLRKLDTNLLLSYFLRVL